MATLHGVYRFKDYIDILSDEDIVLWSPKFTCVGKTWSYMCYIRHNVSRVSLYYCNDPDNPISGLHVFSSITGWTNEQYRTIIYEDVDAGYSGYDEWLANNCDIKALSDVRGTTWVFDDTIDYNWGIYDSARFHYVDSGIVKLAYGLDYRYNAAGNTLSYVIGNSVSTQVYNETHAYPWPLNGCGRAITFDAGYNPELKTIAFLITVASKTVQLEYNGEVIGHMVQGQQATFQCKHYRMSGSINIRSAYRCPCTVYYGSDCLAESTGRISIDVNDAIMRHDIGIYT